MLATIEQTKSAALALLAPLADEAHVQADKAEANGDNESAALHRDHSWLPESGYRELTVDRQYVPRTLQGFTAREIIAHFLADIDDVLGVNRYGVNVAAASTAILGESMPLWHEVMEQPLRTLEALALMLIAEVRSARAMSKVYRGISAS